MRMDRLSTEKYLQGRMDRRQGPTGLLGKSEQRKLSTFDLSFSGSLSLFQAEFGDQGEVDCCAGLGMGRWNLVVQRSLQEDSKDRLWHWFCPCLCVSLSKLLVAPSVQGDPEGGWASGPCAGWDAK